MLVNVDAGVAPLFAILGQCPQLDLLDLLAMLRNGAGLMDDDSQLLLHGIRGTSFPPLRLLPDVTDDTAKLRHRY